MLHLEHFRNRNPAGNPIGSPVTNRLTVDPNTNYYYLSGERNFRRRRDLLDPNADI